MSEFQEEAQYQNMMRHLTKINDTLSTARQYFVHDSRAKSAMHCSEEVYYSPIVAMLKQAMDSVSFVQNYLDRDKVAEESINKEVYDERNTLPKSPKLPERYRGRM